MSDVQSQPENIVFLFPDQLRADFLGCYGANFALTPNIDGLAARGQLFERCLSPNPICVPARASLMTGVSTVQCGVMSNDCWLRPDAKACGIETWPSLLSEAGYDTYAVGKMHFTPWDASEGFSHRVICEDKRHIGIKDDYSEYLTSINASKIHGREMSGYYENAGACLSALAPNQQVDAWCADRAIEIITAQHPDKPFAMMIGFPSPHCPYDPPPEIAALFDVADMPVSFAATEESEQLRPWLIENMKNDWADIDYSTFSTAQKSAVRAHYSALIHLVDKAIGRILDALQQADLAENTRVILSSDHGDFVGDFDLICKNFFMEGAVRVPLIISRVGEQPSTRKETVCLSDLYPTILQLAGIAPRADVQVKDLLAADGQSDRAVFGATHRGFMVELGRIKLAKYQGGLVTLYDINLDPQEQLNLYHNPQYFEVREKLLGLLNDWQIEQGLLANAEKRILYRPGVQEGEPNGDFGARNWRRMYPHNDFTIRGDE